MSKLDAQRAMREAAYAARQAGNAPTRGRARTPAAGTTPAADRRPPVAPPAADAPAADVAAPATESDAGLCGHRSMNGRTCTREAGHPQKNHRYS